MSNWLYNLSNELVPTKFPFAVVKKCVAPDACKGHCVRQGNWDVCRCDYPLDESCTGMYNVPIFADS